MSTATKKQIETPKDGWHRVGTIGVDAGLCWIGDPCYILGEERPVKSVGEDWGEFCHKLWEGDLIPVKREINGREETFHKTEFEITQAKSFNYELGHEGLGVVVGTGYGDGCYPVYAKYKNGRVMEVKVKFE